MSHLRGAGGLSDGGERLLHDCDGGDQALQLSEQLLRKERLVQVLSRLPLAHPPPSDQPDRVPAGGQGPSDPP
eukprot:5515127-Pyramimonas_sp.AAC.1